MLERTTSEAPPKFLSADLCRAEYLREKTASKVLTGMDRNNRDTSVRVPQEVMTPLAPNHFETVTLKG